MAENKRYYWLKLMDDFFDSKRIKKLRKLAGGDTYTIIYLKMQLLSLKKGGYLEYSGLEDEFYKEVALDIDEDEANVQVTVQFLLSCGLLQTSDNIEYVLPFVKNNLGSETASTRRSRISRQNAKKALQCNTMQQNCNVEIEKDKELDKEKDKRSAKPVRHKYGEYKNVLLTDEDMEKLKAEFPDDWEKRIERLSDYIESTGKSYKNHLATIRNWAKRDNEKEAAEKKQKNDGWCMPNADDDIDLTKIFG